MKVYDGEIGGKKVKKVFCREEKEAIPVIREALVSDKAVEVVNEYETFYGVGFDRWLREALEDLNPEYVVTSVNHWEGYPWSYEITLK